ncbi:MAG: hypothetical protein O2816_10515 [Planctomycetota bacterium]|nr:hypothetical protein [Planctomycetota bacterium]
MNSSFRVGDTARNEVGARFLAEAGLAESVDALRRGAEPNLGQNGAPVDCGTGSFWVAVTDEGSGRFALVSTGMQGRAACRVELVIEGAESNLWSYGAFGDLGLRMESNAHVDSYDSGDGYSAGNGSGNDKWDKANGHVGANGNVTLESNAAVYGNAVPGPAGSTVLNGNSTVSGATAPNTQVVELPPIEVPSIASTGDWFPSGTVSLGGGDHAFDAFELDGNSTLTITGPARIVCDNMYLESNSSIVVDATLGGVEFYVRDDFVMNSNTLIASTELIPADVAMYLETNNIIDPDADVDLDEVDFDSNAKLYGTVYAPNAHVEINSNFELFGALVAKSVHLDSNSYIHFDEALLDQGDDSSSGQFTRVCWRELPVPASEIQW